jgi:hypothetical protein
VNPQRPLIDDRVGPGACDQQIFTDCLAGAFDKHDQDVQSPTAEAQRLLVFEQHPLRRDQPKRSKDEGFFIHRGHPKGGLPLNTDREDVSQRDSRLPRRVCVTVVLRQGYASLIK